MTILEVVRPIIIRTYGDGVYSRALCERLAGRIVTASYDPPDEADREATVRRLCFDSFANGRTASAVAAQIEAALREAGY